MGCSIRSKLSIRSITSFCFLLMYSKTFVCYSSVCDYVTKTMCLHPCSLLVLLPAHFGSTCACMWESSKTWMSFACTGCTKTPQATHPAMCDSWPTAATLGLGRWREERGGLLEEAVGIRGGRLGTVPQSGSTWNSLKRSLWPLCVICFLSDGSPSPSVWKYAGYRRAFIG